MPSDLRERIVGMVDTAAPPIDVEALAQQLAAESARDPRRDAAIPPIRRRVWAFAGAFAGVLVLVGGALAGGVWLHKPTTTDLNGFGDATTAPDAVTSGWWLIAFAVVVVGLGAAAWLAGRRRNQRLRTREEDAMQTMERTERTTDREVEKLTTQRRWLAVALAFVLVVGAVAIGWLVAENRSLSSETDAAVWPAESELTARQQYMLDVVGPGGVYHETFNADDFDAFYALHSPGAFQVHGDEVFPLATNRELLEATTLWHAERVARTWILGEWNAAVVVEYRAAPGQQLLVFTFSPSGEQPLIYSVTYFGVERDSSLLAQP